MNKAQTFLSRVQSIIESNLTPVGVKEGYLNKAIVSLEFVVEANANGLIVSQKRYGGATNVEGLKRVVQKVHRFSNLKSIYDRGNEATYLSGWEVVDSKEKAMKIAKDVDKLLRELAKEGDRAKEPFTDGRVRVISLKDVYDALVGTTSNGKYTDFFSGGKEDIYSRKDPSKAYIYLNGGDKIKLNEILPI